MWLPSLLSLPCSAHNLLQQGRKIEFFNQHSMSYIIVHAKPVDGIGAVKDAPFF